MSFAMEEMINPNKCRLAVTEKIMSGDTLYDGERAKSHSCLLQYMTTRADYFCEKLPSFSPTWKTVDNKFDDKQLDSLHKLENELRSRFIGNRGPQSSTSSVPSIIPSRVTFNTNIQASSSSITRETNDDNDDGFQPMTLRTTSVSDLWLRKYPEFAHDFEVHGAFKKLIETLDKQGDKIVFQLDLKMENNATDDHTQRLTVQVCVNNRKYQLQSVSSGFYEKTRNLAVYRAFTSDLGVIWFLVYAGMLRVIIEILPTLCI